MTIPKLGWVAVIDDDDSLRRAYTRFLSAHGIRSTSYASAEEFVESAAAERPACLVLDMHLQLGMSAFDLVDRMERDGTRVPIIFATGAAEVTVEMSDRYPELHDRLIKPFDVQDLVARVNVHLARSANQAI